ncbi:Glucans biosynthesis protein G precursor [Halomonas sp. THAF12]|uniref:glucan biosynthesis protein n=1 Tax=Halomonas sp. THAF12 TaxID=2587849 RepID=UPI0012697E50|nr:glucan biosynthesis protein G [Halomonas sp. THAF12]QFT84428.1 Glucans biosynthesis protein G precursor [Halomonas sp. THAF12]
MTSLFHLLALSLGATLAMEASAEPAAEQGLFERVTDRAERLADAPYEAPDADLPPALTELDYDAYRQIRFRPDRAVWHDDGLFEVQLFHPGFLYDQPVALNLVDGDGEVSALTFDPSRFRYDDEAAGLADLDPEALGDLGYAGFRLHYPLNSGDYRDEFMVFLGASYFRMVGRDQGYGLSSRGLAIDTGAPRGEEFPAFREFWLVEPGPDDTHLTVYALLDSPSLSGAYRFEIAPGEPTTVETEARLFAREDVAKLGIAPLTSMYMHGGLGEYPADDYRPRVHDSSGLAMQTGDGERIWRPLSNPATLHLSSLQDASPRGFGLIQRPRQFEAYLDAEARYETRPSEWVTPLGDWGQGRVELVEIPSDSEANDNITAYWIPEQPLEAGQSRTFRYRLSTLGATPPEQRLAHVLRSRQGWGATPGQDDPPPESQRVFIVDFQGPTLDGLEADQAVEPHLTTSSGELIEPRVQRLPDGTWRASFRLAPEDGTPADMRLALTLHGEPLTETWNYVWYPDERR